ncbi:hypothetical protein L7F22_009965 [Adiantum nelumboides]|nr:hypothetical protein [Adiantum nelumboides]
MSKLCRFFLRGTCNKGDECKFTHSFTSCANISFLTQLSGHERPSALLRSRQGIMLAAFSNLQSGTEQACIINGQVHSLAMANGMLMAGAQDGSILAWKFNSVVSMFESMAALRGHTGAVVTLEASEDQGSSILSPRILPSRCGIS